MAIVLTKDARLVDVRNGKLVIRVPMGRISDFDMAVWRMHEVEELFTPYLGEELGQLQVKRS